MKSHAFNPWIVVILGIIISNNGFVRGTQNLSCYQCVRTTDTECSSDELLPCPSNTDRCVTHIMKDEEDGFKIKRECGLGPCTFQDLMATKALGIDVCDRSRREYFCIFCCRENGCNKAGVAALIPTIPFIAFNVLMAIIIKSILVP